jgi:hypothetical protein
MVKAITDVIDLVSYLYASLTISDPCALMAITTKNTSSDALPSGW